MKKRVFVGATMALIGFLGYAAFNWISFAADELHSESMHRVVEFLRESNVRREAAKIRVPEDLRNPDRLRRASGNYDAMCMVCHLKPEAKSTELSQGLYPAPPALTSPRKDTIPARDFWIIKHGIKGSGMPSWGAVGLKDEEIWDLVAFIETLPGMSRQDYGTAVSSGIGHHHSHH